MVLRYIGAIADAETLDLIKPRLAKVAPVTEKKMQTINETVQQRGERLGEKRGEAKGKAEGVLAVLEARGLAVAAEQRELILACQDVRTLDRWLRKAVTVRKAATLFAD